MARLLLPLLPLCLAYDLDSLSLLQSAVAALPSAAPGKAPWPPKRRVGAEEEPFWHAGPPDPGPSPPANRTVQRRPGEPGNASHAALASEAQPAAAAAPVAQPAAPQAAARRVRPLAVLDPGLPDVQPTVTESKDTTHNFWIFGIALTLTGQTVCVAGLQLQKISHETHTPKSSQPALRKRSESSLLGFVSMRTSFDDSEDLVDHASFYFMKWRWLLGGLVWATGHVTCWCALGLAPQSILACLQSWNIIVNFALAPVILGEEVPTSAIPLCLLLVGGCTLVIIFGPRPKEYEMQTVDSLSKAFFDLEAMVVHGVCVLAFVLLQCSPLLRSKAMAVPRFAATSAISAWYAALCSKSMSMLAITSVSDSVPGGPQVKHFGFYAFLFSFVFFAVGQVHYMNMALREGSACSVIPMYEGLSLTGQVFFGGILFREFRFFTAKQQLGFWPGIVLVLAALALLVQENNAAESRFGSEASEKSERPEPGVSSEGMAPAAAARPPPLDMS